MSILQTPDDRLLIALSSSGTLDRLAGISVASGHFDLAQIILSMIKVGPWVGAEQMRLKLFPSALHETPVAVSAWLALTELGSPEPANWLGTVPFTFEPAVPLNYLQLYYLAIETTGYTKTPTFYVGVLLDTPDDVNTAAAATSRGAQLRILGYRSPAADAEAI